MKEVAVDEQKQEIEQTHCHRQQHDDLLAMNVLVQKGTSDHGHHHHRHRDRNVDVHVEVGDIGQDDGLLAEHILLWLHHRQPKAVVLRQLVLLQAQLVLHHLIQRNSFHSVKEDHQKHIGFHLDKGQKPDYV